MNKPQTNVLDERTNTIIEYYTNGTWNKNDLFGERFKAQEALNHFSNSIVFSDYVLHNIVAYAQRIHAIDQLMLESVENN